MEDQFGRNLSERLSARKMFHVKQWAMIYMPNTNWLMFHVKQNLFSRMIRFAVWRDRQQMAKAAKQLSYGADYSGPLAREYGTYRRHLGRLVRDAGQYVLVEKDDIVGVYDSYQSALEAGYQKFGLEPFLVKCIGAKPILAR